MRPDSEKMSFAARLGEVMEEKGLTQMQLANLVGVAQSRVSEWKSGRGLPQRRVAEALAQQLFLNVEWLLEGTGQKTPEQKSRHILSTAVKIAERAKGAGLTPQQAQIVFEAAESVIRQDSGGHGTDWQVRAKEAEERALAAEKKLEKLQKTLKNLLEEIAL